MKLAAFCRSSRFHLYGTLLWLVLLPPTLLWWQDSIPYLVVLSWYANFIGSFSAYQAARAEEAQKSDAR
jgi:hypothetical protein